MPYQLIYTSAAQLLDSPLSGYGVVARSENMPTALIRSLVELSEYKEPAEQGILGTQFSYRVEECGNSLYHIFTSVRPAGADYSKRSCHLAHHLILRDEEMHALCRSAARPTPAGILLSLELRRFWLHRWQREPEFISEGSMPPLWDSPSAENFPTWLIFTGQGDNAHAFNTPPYQQGCLVLVPQKTQSRDILRLLHESYSLSPTLGWGIPFCTYSVEGDTLESRTRLFSVEGSALHRRALRVGFPVLDIRPGLTLPTAPAAPAPAPTATQPVQPSPVNQAQQPAPSAVPSLSTLPVHQTYHYTENREVDVFEKPWRKERKKIPVITLVYCIAALLLAAAGTAFVLFFPGHSEQSPSADPPHIATVQPIDTPEITTTPEPQPAETPDDTTTTPEPQPTETPADTTTPEPQPTETPADTTTTPEPQPIEEPDNTSSAEDRPLEITLPTTEITKSKKCEIILTGKKLPATLLNALPKEKNQETAMEHGEYKLHIANQKEFLCDKFINKTEYRKEISLEPGVASLVLRNLGENRYSITSSNSKTPTVTLTIVDKQLVACEADGNRGAAIQLPIVQGNEWIPHLLLPEIEINIKPLPKQEALAINGYKILHSLDQLRIKDKANTRYELKLTDKQEKEDRSISSVPVNQASTKLYLPILTSKGNDVKFTVDKDSDITCAQEKEKDPEGAINLTYTRVRGVYTSIKEEFDKLMNAPWLSCRKDGQSPLTRAKVYHYISAFHNKLDTNKKSKKDKDIVVNSKALQEFCRLFSGELGKKLTNDIYSKHKQILPYSDMTDKQEKRQYIGGFYENKDEKEYLLEDYRQYLCEELEAITDRAKVKMGYPLTDHTLILKKVEIKKDSLEWTFELKKQR